MDAGRETIGRRRAGTRPSRRALLVACLALAGLAATFAVAAAPAGASKDQVSIIQDERRLYDGSTRGQTLDQFRRIGADWVKVLVEWRNFAPDPESEDAPEDFDASDPDAYPSGTFRDLDEIVRAATERNLDVMLTPTGPSPLWASRKERSQVWRPSSKRFGRFVEALGKRYSGKFQPGGDGEALPRVKRWSIWNEPNQPAWLQPQFRGGDPESPHRYRDLLIDGLKGLDESGHGRRDLILLGETSPLGDNDTGNKAKMRPGVFLRELFCTEKRSERSSRLKRTRDGDCKRFDLDDLDNVDGVAHHPYHKFRADTPESEPRDTDELPFGGTDELVRLIKQAEKQKRLPRGTDLYFTEYGWQTDPPDETLGVPERKQAEFINLSDEIAYGEKRIKSVSQYLLGDDPEVRAFQTGLRFEDDEAKESYDAYRLPLVLERARSKLRIWGNVRPNDGREDVQLLFAETKNGEYGPSGDPRRTNERGYFRTSRAAEKGWWKLAWTDPSGDVHESRKAKTPKR